MVESGVVLSPAKYYEEAKKMLEVKDLVGFVSNVTSAILLANSYNDHEMLAKTTFLKASGLVKFRQFKKVSESVDEALKYNMGGEAFELKKKKGLAKGYLGELDEALKIFKELLTESDDSELLAGVYVNIAWVHLTLNKNISDTDLIESKTYLDLAEQKFDLLSNDRKWKVRNAYSVYYFYKKEYDKAVEILEDSIKYCKEENLADTYNNLADLYMHIVKEDDIDTTDLVRKYLHDAEIIASKYKNNLVLGFIFYTKAMLEVHEEQIFRALDTLYLSFEFFKDAEDIIQACNTLLKLNELMDKCKSNSIKAIRDNLKYKIDGTPYQNIIKS